MRFSPFNPIHFAKPDADCIRRGGYVRTFAESDTIMLEVFFGVGEEMPALELLDAESEVSYASVALKEYRINDNVRMGMLEKSGFTAGCYRLRLGAYVSECFNVLPECKAHDTVLFQYAHRYNKDREDVLTRIFGGIRYFSLRVHGGFKDSGWTFGVTNEQYATQYGDCIELSAVDHTDKILIIGSSPGVDIRTAELVNRVLTCPLVFIDDTRYARVDGSVLDSDTCEDEGLAVYSIMLREARFMNTAIELAVMLNLRRTPSALRRAGERPRRYR